MNNKHTFMQEIEILNISNNLIEKNRAKLKTFAEKVIKVVSYTNHNVDAESVITYPLGINEVEWCSLGKYYHKQKNGKDINFRAYHIQDCGGFHEEFCSGFDDESVVIILFNQPIWNYVDVMLDYKANYLIFSDDENDAGCYPCGLAYYFKK